MRRFLILIVVLVILAVAVDRAAWWFAQRTIAEQIQTEQNLAVRPDVNVGGFPFLTQVLRGRYQQIDANLQDPAADGGLQIDQLDIRLRGVQVSTRDVLNQDVDSVPVDSAAAVATVSFQALNDLAKENLPDSRSQLKFAQGSGDALKITGEYRTASFKAQLDLQARLVAKDGDLVVQVPDEAYAGLLPAVRPQVQSLVEKAARLPSLPFGFQAQTVTVNSTGVTVRATSSALELQR